MAFQSDFPDFAVRRQTTSPTRDFLLKSDQQVPAPPPPEPSVSEVTPPIGETPPDELARDAAAGRRGAAWRLMFWILNNDPRAMMAVSSLDDDRLAQHLLEFMALGTWAGKPFVVPLPLRSHYARTRLRTLFMPGAGIPEERVKRVLVQALFDPRDQLRESAAYLYSIVGTPQDVPVLIEALNDSNYGVRYQVAKALGHTRSPEAIPALVSALTNADEQLGSQIFRSLIAIGSAAVPALIELSNDSRAWVRWDCVHALGEIADNRAITPLALALNDPDHGVAWMAARELVHFGRLSVEPVLRVLMLKNTSPWLVETGSYTLHEIAKEYPRLQPYLQPVIRGMHGVAYNIATPLAARKALEQLESSGILRTRLL
jgi:hypothetical protein